jgi:spore maturation protein CgeB
MYQAIRDSRVVLNIHADSSPTHASNMRLFEITGAGACMLTDRKQNIADFFEPDREVVVYDGAQDCMEKALWLLGHPTERCRVAAAGQRRTLSDHTFARRAAVLDQIVRRALTQARA